MSLEAAAGQAQIGAKAGRPRWRVDPLDLGLSAKAVELVGTTLRYTEEQRAGILDHFIKGGQTTAGGVFQAVTSFVQELDDADIAFELEALAMRALDIAAR